MNSPMKIGRSKSIGFTLPSKGPDFELKLKRTLSSPHQFLLPEDSASYVNTTTDETSSEEFDAVETSIDGEKKELDSFDLQNSEYDVYNESFEESPIKFEVSPVYLRRCQSSSKVLKDVEKKYKKYSDSFSSDDQSESLTYSKRSLTDQTKDCAENKINRVDIELTLNVSDMKKVENSVKECLTKKEFDCYESIKDTIRFYELQKKLKANGLKGSEMKDYLKNHVPSLDLKGRAWKLFNVYFLESTKIYDENSVKKFTKLLKKPVEEKKLEQPKWEKYKTTKTF